MPVGMGESTARTIRNPLDNTRLLCHLWGCATSLATPAARLGYVCLEFIGSPEVHLWSQPSTAVGQRPM